MQWILFSLVKRVTFTSEMNYWGQEKKACYMGIYN